VIFDQLSPAILGGTIKVWCLDPNRGMEMAPVRRCSTGSSTAM